MTTYELTAHFDDLKVWDSPRPASIGSREIFHARELDAQLQVSR